MSRFIDHLQIVEPNHRQPLRSQPGGTPRIVFKVGRFKMLAAIHFNDKVDCRRIKIDDVFADWALPKKWDAEQLFSPEVKPEPLFCVRHVAAQVAGFLLQVVAVLEWHGDFFWCLLRFLSGDEMLKVCDFLTIANPSQPPFKKGGALRWTILHCS